MLRRSHKKSRKGAKCDECRRRHIRCDQQRPICINCSQADRSCSYQDRPVPQQSGSSGVNPAEYEDTRLSSSSKSPAAALPQNTADQDAPNDHLSNDISGSVVNLTHLELFHHFGEVVSPLFIGRDPELRRVYLQTYYKAAFTGDYLMHEMLAFAARHLSLTGPSSKSQFYADQATMLQTRALSLFTASLQNPKPENIISTFLFSSLLGTHLLSDTIASRHMELDQFFSHFAHYLKVHRGVRPIFTEFREVLLNSELRPQFIWGWNLNTSKGTGPECQPIREMISRGNLDSSDAEAYTLATDTLQTIIDGLKNFPAFPGPAPWVTVWFSVARPEYTELLIARQPEALVIFAYYGAMIHCYHRELWLVGDSGKHIIELVTKALGPEWKPWLTWPCQALEF